jgi:hypothetical protein
MDASFIQDRITATKALIVAYENAIDAIVSGTVQSYTLDTGQSKQTVTKIDLNALNASLDGLYNRCATLEARLNGSGTIITRPSW